jgi:IPT/TIG domain-containing protein
MTNGTHTTLAFALLALVTACSDGRSPTPSTSLPLPTSPTPPATGVRPVVTGITPSIGSDRGGGWGAITGTDFTAGAILTLGGSGIRIFSQDRTTLRFSGIPAHAIGTVDVVVTNPGGLSGTLSNGYTFASPASFDFSGDWIAHAGPEYEIDMRFAIRQNQLVSLSCGGVAVALSAPAEVLGAEFSVGANAGVTMTGTLVSPVNAVGTIDVPACSSRWWADKVHD